MSIVDDPKVEVTKEPLEFDRKKMTSYLPTIETDPEPSRQT